MPSYKAPLDEIRFILNDVLGAGELGQHVPAFEQADIATVNMILESTSAYAEQVAQPLNASGDIEGCTHNPQTKSVKTPEGFKSAYNQFRELGLIGLNGSEQYGGLGLPFYISAAVNEIMTGANMSLATYPGLTSGAAKVLEKFADEKIKNKYLSKMYEGSWSGTMCLTEPQAGTDLGLIKTKAEKTDDGHYLVSGEKIFITCGDQDMTENIAHLVLARTPGAPEGTRGISLFLVPKHTSDENGNLTEKNTLHCSGLWEKMGVHGSVTATMHFENAKGYLIGEENKGLKYMFEMMNDARLKVGMQGLGLSEVAYQNITEYASQRKQGAPVTNPKAGATEIINHSNVRKDLIEIKSQIDGYRALLYDVALQLDAAEKHPEETARHNAREYASLLTPILKACTTDFSLDATEKAIQLHGGAGFIKETGVEQFYRDSLIGSIWEGTNDVQSMDFTFRKAMDPKDLGYRLGLFMNPLAEEIEQAKSRDKLAQHAVTLEKSMKTFQNTAMSLIQQGMAGQVDEILVHAKDFMDMFGKLAVGRMWLKMMSTAQQKLEESPSEKEKEFYSTKINLGEYYLNRVMSPDVKRLEMRIDAGGAIVRKTSPEQLTAKNEMGIAASQSSSHNKGYKLRFPF
jgi:alkylation response protein AidB-like acyl-CoA dehydrogenase